MKERQAAVDDDFDLNMKAVAFQEIVGFYLRQTFFSVLYLRARTKREGSMIPPRSRKTKCRVDSAIRWLLEQVKYSISSFIPTFLDIVIGQSAAILELLSSKDQSLLIGGNALLVLNLALHHVNGVRGLDLLTENMSTLLNFLTSKI